MPAGHVGLLPDEVQEAKWRPGASLLDQIRPGESKVVDELTCCVVALEQRDEFLKFLECGSEICGKATYTGASGLQFSYICSRFSSLFPGSNLLQATDDIEARALRAADDGGLLPSLRWEHAIAGHPHQAVAGAESMDQVSRRSTRLMMRRGGRGRLMAAPLASVTEITDTL